MTNLVVHNPLPHALAHYQSALTETLDEAGFSFQIARSPSIEGETNRLRKTSEWLSYLRTESARRDTHHLVLWPPMGYLELAASRLLRGSASIMVHDPRPLRKQIGLGQISSRFGRVVGGGRCELIVHSLEAAAELERRHLQSVVLPHPVTIHNRALPGRRRSTRAARIVRVIGQHKPSRRMDVMTRISDWRDKQKGTVQLEIHGHGWERVPGWEVNSRWYSETDFDELIETSDAVIIPYTEYYQSGVAVRALERLVPVVAAGHWFGSFFGEDYGGRVRSDAWEDALGRALALPAEEARLRRKAATSVSLAAWTAWARCAS